MGGRRRRVLVRCAFAAALVLFALQYVVEPRRGEPYPGLYMPSFGSVPQAGNEAFTSEPVVVVTYGDGGRRTFSARRLLPDNPVLATDTLRSAFVDRDLSGDPAVRRWLRDLVRAAAPERRDPRGAEVRVVSRAYAISSGRVRIVDEERVRTIDLGGGA